MSDIINDIRTRAERLFQPGTARFYVPEFIGKQLRFDCDTGHLIEEDGTVEDASEEVVSRIQKWLIENPPLPTSLTPHEIGLLLTPAEEDLIEAKARRLARELFFAIEPIPYEKLAETMRQLSAVGLIAPERLKQILACQPVGE